MADNPNKSSARYNMQEGGVPRRGGVPSNPRLLDFIETDYRRPRNSNFQSLRSNGRNRSERPQSSPNNRNRFDRPSGSSNSRNHFERPPNMRTRLDRSNGNYSAGRVFYSSTMNRDLMNGENEAPGLNSSNRNISEQQQTEGNSTVAENKEDNPVEDPNSGDQETDNFATSNNNMELPPIPIHKVSGDGCDRCCRQLAPHLHLPTPVRIISCGDQRSELHDCMKPHSDAGSEKCGSDQENQQPNNSKVTPEHLDSLTEHSEGFQHSVRPTMLIAENHRAVDRSNFDRRGRFDPSFPVCNGSRTRSDVSSTVAVPVNQNKIPHNNVPRPIKGRFTPVSYTATGGVPRPITKRNISNSADSENRPDLPHTVTSGALHEEWANAPEFFPQGSKPKSYAEVLNPKTEKSDKNTEKGLCPFAEKSGVCKISPDCPYIHGDICELCGLAALHPTDTNQRKQHHQTCLERHEKDMELSFAIARSKEKTCGICFEVVVEKQSHERRFGILTKCNHCFCLGCIRKWRQARQFENKVVRACPECRVTSDFVCPSLYWVETKEDKDKLIDDYKNALAEKECKYFKQGRGSCPFGNKCFYLHALPDGTKTDVGPPPRRRRHRNRHVEDGELGDMLQQIILWDFLDEPDNHWLYSFADDLEELVTFFSDSDDSEWSDYEFLLE